MTLTPTPAYISLMRFSDWLALDELQDLPEQSGLFQVRLKSGLLEYPVGKSAMFYYGYAENLKIGCQQFVDSILPKLGQNAHDLLLRTMPLEAMADRFKPLIQQFARNFGSLPKGNEIYLRILEDLTK